VCSWKTAAGKELVVRMLQREAKKGFVFVVQVCKT
jgi:hypothetical protein